jgi:hypothetical protein
MVKGACPLSALSVTHLCAISNDHSGCNLLVQLSAVYRHITLSSGAVEADCNRYSVPVGPVQLLGGPLRVLR